MGRRTYSQAGELVLPGEARACAPAPLRRIGPREAEIELTEGRYHQVRRMFASQGCTVLELHRIRIGRLDLGSLATGKWTELPINYFDSD